EEGFAAQHGMTPEEYLAACDQQVKDMVAGSEVWTRVSTSTLGKILDSGSIKSQFDASASGTAGRTQKILNSRTRAEEAMFGYSATGTAPADRPIYGYLSKTSNGAGSSELDMYGNVAIHLSSAAVHSRTSFTLGDSGDGTLMGQFPLGGPSPLTHPSGRSLLISGGVVKPDFLPSPGADYNSRPYYYAEAQIHGGVSTSHIQHVVFHTGGGKKPPAALLSKLKRQGISYTIV